jgi:hypothetical protein
MKIAGVLIILAFSIVLSAVLSARSRRRRLRRQLKAEWGAKQPARTTDEDAMTLIRQCFSEMPAPETAQAWVDEITWKDLDMDKVFQYLNRTQSGIGEETLYRMLHATDASDETLLRRERWMRALSGDEKNRTALQKRLRALGRDHDHGAFAYIADPEIAKPAHAWLYYALALAPLVFVVLGLFNPYLFLGILGSFIVNTMVYYGSKRVWMRELGAIRRLASMLLCARKMRRYPVAGMEDAFRELQSFCAALRPMVLWNSLHEMERVHEFDFITDYLRIAFQLDVVSLIRLSGFIKKHGAEITRLYLLVGELDACVAVASVRESLSEFAVPEFWDQKRVLADSIAHPLIQDPVINSMDWKENVLVTGSNASGKSTFVKAIAINAVLAQSIYTCWAGRFQMPRAQVMSSMAIRDNVEGGESYFIVEIKSLKRILLALRDDTPTLIFIDEILRGTNTVERIAASTALLTYLSAQNALCVAATHDIELTKLLPAYRQVHFREEITPQGMVFPYKLCEGVSDTRNAIRLLEQMGFPAEVIEAADTMAAADQPAQSDAKA